MERRKHVPFILYNLNDPLFNRIVGGSLCAEGRFNGTIESTYRRFVLCVEQVNYHAKTLKYDGQSYVMYVDESLNAYMVDCLTREHQYKGEFKRFELEYLGLDKVGDYTQFFGNPDSYYYVREYK